MIWPSWEVSRRETEDWPVAAAVRTNLAAIRRRQACLIKRRLVVGQRWSGRRGPIGMSTRPPSLTHRPRRRQWSADGDDTVPTAVARSVSPKRRPKSLRIPVKVTRNPSPSLSAPKYAPSSPFSFHLSQLRVLSSVQLCNITPAVIRPDLTGITRQ